MKPSGSPPRPVPDREQRPGAPGPGGELAEQGAAVHRGDLWHVQRLAEGGGEVARVHGELEGPGGQVVAQPHNPNRRSYQDVLLGSVDPGEHPGGELLDCCGGIGSQGGAGLAASLGHRGGSPPADVSTRRK